MDAHDKKDYEIPANQDKNNTMTFFISHNSWREIVQTLDNDQTF